MMLKKMTPERRRAYEMFAEGTASVDEIAREIEKDRSTVYRWRQDWEHEQVARAAEEAKPDPLSFLKTGFDQLWRWPKEDRPWVLAALHRLDKKLVYRDPDATAPPGYSAVEVLEDFVGIDHGAEDTFSEAVTASSAQEGE